LPNCGKNLNIKNIIARRWQLIGGINYSNSTEIGIKLKGVRGGKGGTLFSPFIPICKDWDKNFFKCQV